MKKTILFIAAIAAVAIGCNKSKNDTATTTTTPTTFVVNGTTFTQLKGQDSVTSHLFGHTTNTLVAIGATAGNAKLVGVYLYSFTTARPAAGTHNIGGTFNVSAANQMQLMVIDSSSTGQGIYSADSVTSVNATLTETSGKLTATIPSIKLAGLFTPVGGTTYNDTITVSGTLKEQ